MTSPPLYDRDGPDVTGVDLTGVDVAAPTGPDARPLGLWILGRPDESPRLTAVRTQILLTGLIAYSNALGIAAVCVLAAFVVPGPRPADPLRVAVDNLILGVAYSALYVVAGLVWGRHMVTENTSWLRSGRPPTTGEQRAILQLPLFLAGFQVFFWLAAAGVFAVFNAAIGDHLTVQISLAVVTGGGLAVANSYVTGELLARPLAARALAGGPPARLAVPGVRARAILAWILGSAVPIADLMIAAAAALTRSGFTTTRLAVTILVLGGVVLTFGLRITFVAARANADPIGSLRRAMQRIGNGDLDVSVPIYDGTEIGQLQAGFNQMAAGLRERERIREVFEHHVGALVAETALAAGESGLGGETCDAGVFFVDIVGSTAMAARLPPDEVVALLNGFFEVVVDVAGRHGGIVNKFEGDGALVVFGAPAPLPDPAGAALAAGRDLVAALEPWRDRFEVGIGISSGQVVAGNIGAPARYEYTVIGDPVNEAARLTDLAKGEPGRLVASWSTVEAASPAEQRHWAPGDEVELRGRRARTRKAVPTTRPSHPSEPSL